MYDLLNNIIICPELLAPIRFRIPTYFSENHDVFIIPYLNLKNSKIVFSQNIKTCHYCLYTLDFFHTSRDIFRVTN